MNLKMFRRGGALRAPGWAMDSANFFCTEYLPVATVVEETGIEFFVDT